MSALDNLFCTIQVGTDPLAVWTPGWGEGGPTGDSFNYARLGRYHQLSGNIRYTGTTGAGSSGDALVANFAAVPGLIAPPTNQGSASIATPTGNAARWLLNPSKGLYIRSASSWTMTSGESWFFQISWLA